jgi:GTP-binding protein HflX
VLISAATKANLELLLAEIDRALRSRMAAIDVQIPYERGDLVAFLHEHGTVEAVTHSESGTHLVGHLPIELIGRLAPYWTASEPVAEE